MLKDEVTDDKVHRRIITVPWTGKVGERERNIAGFQLLSGERNHAF